MMAAVARSGELLSYNNIAQEIGVSVDIIKRWITILEVSGIIYLLRPYFIITSNEPLKPQKSTC